jgi:hypothetical protein
MTRDWQNEQYRTSPPRPQVSWRFWHTAAAVLVATNRPFAWEGVGYSRPEIGWVAVESVAAGGALRRFWSVLDGAGGSAQPRPPATLGWRRRRAPHRCREGEALAVPKMGLALPSNRRRKTWPRPPNDDACSRGLRPRIATPASQRPATVRVKTAGSRPARCCGSAGRRLRTSPLP